MWELGGLHWFILKNFGMEVKFRLQEINEGEWYRSRVEWVSVAYSFKKFDYNNGKSGDIEWSVLFCFILFLSK